MRSVGLVFSIIILASGTVCEMEETSLYGTNTGTRDIYSEQAYNDMIFYNINTMKAVRSSSNESGTELVFKLDMSYYGIIQFAMQLGEFNSTKSNDSDTVINPCRVQQIPSDIFHIHTLETEIDSSYIKSVTTTESGVVVLLNTSKILSYELNFGKEPNITQNVIFYDLNPSSGGDPINYMEVVYLKCAERPENQVAIITNEDVLVVDLSNYSVPRDYSIPIDYIIVNHNLTNITKVKYSKGHLFILSSEGVNVYKVTKSPAIKVDTYLKVGGSRASEAEKVIIDFDVIKDNINKLNVSASTLENQYEFTSPLFPDYSLTQEITKEILEPDALDILILRTNYGIYFVLLDQLFAGTGGFQTSPHFLRLPNISQMIRQGNHLYLLEHSNISDGIRLSTIYEYFLLSNNKTDWMSSESFAPPFDLNKVWRSSYQFSSISVDLNFVYGISGSIITAYQRKIPKSIAAESTLNDYRFTVPKLHSLHHMTASFISFQLAFTDLDVLLYSVSGEEPAVVCNRPSEAKGDFKYNANITSFTCPKKIEEKSSLGKKYFTSACHYQCNFTFKIPEATILDTIKQFILKNRYSSIAFFLVFAVILFLASIFIISSAKMTLKNSPKVKREITLRLENKKPIRGLQTEGS